MDIANRNRRLKEFVLWFEYKYGLNPSNIKTETVQRLIDQTTLLRKLIIAHKPVCYWCRKDIEIMAIDVDEDIVTLHHIDEDRTHNTVDNLDICHKTCHQQMHKNSQKQGLPTAILWTLVYGQHKPTGVKIDVVIPGIGRG